MKMRVLAIGQDTYWLTAVHQATAPFTGTPSRGRHPIDAVKCIADLPRPNTSTVLLLDASDQQDVEGAVNELRYKGWKYVIVIDAASSGQQAADVLRWNAAGYDYWDKTYDQKVILEKVKTCFEEIIREKRLKKTKHKS